MVLLSINPGQKLVMVGGICVAFVTFSIRGEDVTNWVANQSVRIVSGQSFSISDKGWQKISGKIVSQDGALLVVKRFINVPKTGAERTEAARENREWEKNGAYTARPPAQLYTTQLGPPLAITNYFAKAVQDELITLKAMPGT